jgi:hypothetical protein
MSPVNVELRINVSEFSSVSVIRVDVVSDNMSLIFIPVCQIDASSYWYTVQEEGGVKLRGHPTDSNLSPYCFNLVSLLSIILFSF